MPVFYSKLVLSVLFPYAQLLIIAILIFIINTVRANTINFKRGLITAFVVYYVLIQVDIIKILYQAMNCISLDANEEYVLNSEMLVPCHDEEHDWYLKYVVYPNLFLWIMLFPAILFLSLVYYYRSG